MSIPFRKVKYSDELTDALGTSQFPVFITHVMLFSEVENDTNAEQLLSLAHVFTQYCVVLVVVVNRVFPVLHSPATAENSREVLTAWFGGSGTEM